MISKLPPGEVLQPFHAWVGIKRKIFDAMCAEHKKENVSFNAFLNKLVRPALEDWYNRREQKEEIGDERQ